MSNQSLFIKTPVSLTEPPDGLSKTVCTEYFDRSSDTQAQYDS